MSIASPDQKDSPVYDYPPGNAAKKTFIGRRNIGIAGRSLLAEKHLPMTPVNNPQYRKCFSRSLKTLYSFSSTVSEKLHKSKSAKIQIFEPESFEERSQLKPFTAFNRQTSSFSFPETMEQVAKTCARLNLCDSLAEKKPVFPFLTAATEKPVFGNKTQSFKFLVSSCEPVVFADSILPGSVNKQRTLAVGLFNARSAANVIIPKPSDYEPEFSSWQNFSRNELKLIGTNRNLMRTHAWESRELNICKSFYCQQDTKTRKAVGFCKIELTGHYCFEEHGIHRYFLLNNHVANLTLSVLLRARKQLSTNLSLTTRILARLLKKTEHPYFKPCSQSFKEPEYRLSTRENTMFSIKTRGLSIIAATDGPLTYNKKSDEPIAKNLAEKFAEKLHFRLKLKRARFLSGENRQNLLCKRAEFTQKDLPGNVLHAEFIAPKISGTHKPSFCFKDTSPLLEAKFKSRKYLMSALGKNHSRYLTKATSSINKLTHHSQKKLLSIYKCSLAGKNVRSSSQMNIHYEKEKEQAIVVRPIGFLMFFSTVKFSDLQLPTLPRQIRGLHGRFFLRRSSKTIKKRKSSLRSLRFRLHPSRFSHTHTRLKPVRRIYFVRQPLSIFSHFSDQKIHVNSHLMQSQAGDKSIKLCYRGHIEKFAYDTDHYFKAADSMQLSINIMPSGIPEKIEQKNFIEPPPWQKTIRDYICRLTLPPYPFGFPGFLPEREIFFTLASRGNLAQVFIAADELGGPSLYLLKNEQPLYSKTSMKNPRMLFHTGFSANKSAGHYFAESSENNLIKPEKPAVPKSFKHTHLFSSHNLHVLHNIGFSLLEILQKRDFMPEISHKSNSNDFCKRKYLFPEINQMPKVKRFLLRARRFKLFSEKSRADFFLQLLRIKPEIFFCKKLLIARNNFRFRRIDFSFSSPKEPISFAETKPSFSPAACKNSKNFLAMFRVFRFPYKPAHAKGQARFTHFASEHDEQVNLQGSFTEEFRTSNLVVDQFTLHSQALKLFSPFQKLKISEGFNSFSTQPNGITGTENFIHSLSGIGGQTIPDKISAGKLFFANDPHCESFYYPRAVQCFSEILPPQRIYNSFFKSESAPLKNREDYATTTTSSFADSKLGFDSPHWVILLRTFPPARNLSFICSDRKTEISSCFDRFDNFSSVQSFRYCFSKKTESRQAKLLPPELKAIEIKSIELEISEKHNESKIAAMESCKMPAFFHNQPELPASFNFGREIKQLKAFIPPMQFDIKLFSIKRTRHKINQSAAIEKLLSNDFFKPKLSAKKYTAGQFHHFHIPDWCEMKVTELRF